MHKWQTISHSPKATRELGSRLVNTCPGKLIVALYGDLGSGKTCFVQGMAAALQIHRLVTSPTFTIINEYKGARPLYHFDLYRLAKADDLLAIGFEEYCETENGVLAVEWAERAESAFPPDTIHIRFSTSPEENDRMIILESNRDLPIMESWTL